MTFRQVRRGAEGWTWVFTGRRVEPISMSVSINSNEPVEASSMRTYDPEVQNTVLEAFWPLIPEHPETLRWPSPQGR